MKPALMAPPGACDTHMHIFDERYKTAPSQKNGAGFTQPHKAHEY
jgi:predicted TIM-barrel fold metal-dependent hydrolase